MIRDHAYEKREIARVQTLMSQANAVFVFGSNLAGIHGGGAAYVAWKEYDAAWSVGEGLTGRTYAVPTKERDVRTTRPLADIAESVRKLLDVARGRPDLLFAVTRVGCGLAGLLDEQIAPMFVGAPANCMLPEGWSA